MILNLLQNSILRSFYLRNNLLHRRQRFALKLKLLRHVILCLLKLRSEHILVSLEQTAKLASVRVDLFDLRLVILIELVEEVCVLLDLLQDLLTGRNKLVLNLIVHHFNPRNSIFKGFKQLLGIGGPGRNKLL